MKALDLRDTILKTCQSDFPDKMYSLTYNRHDLYHENNTHWISPSSDVPCYGFNKFFFRDHGIKIHYGIQIEKGFKTIVDDKDSRFLMTPTWNWHDSLALIEKGELDRYCKELYESTGKSVKVDISIMDYAWKRRSQSLTLTLNSKGITGSDNLEKFHILGDYFNGIRQFDSSWCNIFIYQVLGPKAIQDLDNQDAELQFYQDYLKPMSYWIR